MKPTTCPACGFTAWPDGETPPGERIRAARKAAGLTMSDVARAANSARQRVYDAENCVRGMTPERLAEWLAAVERATTTKKIKRETQSSG